MISEISHCSAAQVLIVANCHKESTAYSGTPYDLEGKTNMEYRPIKEVADEWGLTVRRLQMLCMEGKIPGAKKIGKLWVVPANPKRPRDNRMAPGSQPRPVKKKTDTHEYNSEIDKRLLTIFSHDVRNSLNAVMGYADILERYKDDPKKVHEYAGKIGDSGRNILSMLETILLVARFESVESIVQKEIMDPEAFLRMILDIKFKDAEERNVSFMVNSDHKEGLVFADKNKLGEIFEHILTNAIKYANEGGVINVTLRELDGAEEGCRRIKYVFEDNGVGMSRWDFKNVYDILGGKSRLDSAEFSDNGLRMAISKRLTELMDGVIKIESKVSTGTKVTFIFEFPIATEEQANNTNVEKTDFSCLSGIRILLAEDDEMNRDIATELLKEAGIAVETAEDGNVCIAKLEANASGYYDCIIMDLLMPNLDGITAAKKIRKLSNKEKARIPIIAMTASIMKEDKEQAIMAGMNDVAEKPFEKEKVYSMLKRVLFE